MSRSEPSDHDLMRTLNELGKGAVPVEDPQRAFYRRERVVRMLGVSLEVHAERQRRSARKWLWASAAAAVLVAGLAGAFTLRSEPVAVAQPSAVVPRSVLGQVTVRRADGATPLRTGEVLVGGEVVSTGARSGVELGIASGHADLGGLSELEILPPTANERRLRLGTGSVDVDLPRKLEAGKHLVVETPDAEVLVVGTAFTVEVGNVAGVRATHVSVRRGTVWIMQGGKQRAVLSAGDDWRSPVATAAVAPAAKEPKAELAPAPGTRAPAVAPRSGVAARPAAGARPVDSGTLAEENRIFRAALAARNAGDNAGAADTFATLLARYPRSVLREQALAGEFRALERAGRSSAATVAARRYLSSYPSGFARADAERVANRL
jgi:hypothetical protein